MSTPKPSPTVKATKKSAFSCEPCRKRKVKCGGEQPKCNRCSARDDLCVYKLSPTLSYTQKLERRIKQLEEQLSQQQGSSQATSSATSPYNIPSQDRLSSEVQLPDLMGKFEGLKLDDKGSITYHGATSFFQLPHDDSAHHVAGVQAPAVPLHGEERRERLVTNAWQQRALETLSEIPEPFQYLLDTHWCWIQPLFNFIYRPTFTRDMEVLGPYYSHTLMNAVLSHSVRWGKSDRSTQEKLKESYDGGALFSRQARTLLFDELSHGHCTIPTVQTLLLLSAQECSHGNRTQAWLYSGIAFRLIDHLGICIDGQKYAGSVKLSDEDLEIRHRLFWSCYFWDKMISLYLGRSPTLQHSMVSPPQIMLDDSAENELWTPHGLVYPEGMEYVPTAAHSISCFMSMCQLSVIFNQILIHIYDPLNQNTAVEIQTCLAHEEIALRQWWADLPDFLRIEPSALPLQAPPSHIVTLNCLYHTFKILLYRPMLSRRSNTTGNMWKLDPNHLIECITSATSIIAIFDLFIRSFGDDHCVLSLSYSVYTAASVFLLQIQAATQDEKALQRLEFCIHTLDRVKTANPVISSALKLITEALSKLGIDTSEILLHTESPRGHFQEGESPGNNFLPLTAPIPAPIIHQSSAPFSFEDSFQLPTLENFNADIFGAFSSLEPITARVGDYLHDFQ